MDDMMHSQTSQRFSENLQLWLSERQLSLQRRGITAVVQAIIDLHSTARSISDGRDERFIYLILLLYCPLTTLFCHLARGLREHKKLSSHFPLKVVPHAAWFLLFIMVVTVVH